MNTGLETLKPFPNYQLSTVFTAAVEATEEAIVNAMVTATTKDGSGWAQG